MNPLISTCKNVWYCDFEFCNPEGGMPRPVCMVAYNACDGTMLRFWEDDLKALADAPFDISKDSVFISYYAAAELKCHAVLGWHFPANVIDFYVEFKNISNGKELPFENMTNNKFKFSLLGALHYFGFTGMEYEDKERMRDLVLSGGPWSEEDKKSIIEYCESDVRALVKLSSKLFPNINIKHAILRGEYMKASALIELIGIPIDMAMYNILIDNWSIIKENLITEVDRNYGIYNGTKFDSKKFESWLNKMNIPWPRLDSGKLDLKDETFRDMAKIYTSISPIAELRYTLSKMKLEKLSIGSDGRNRFMLSAFGSKTGRNQPSNQKSIFGKAVWIRSLIKPQDGYGLAYIDWKQQEFGIAAKLSNDKNMIVAYESGDPYLEFAKQAGSVPQTATKATHGSVREIFKQCALGVLYGMGKHSLSLRVGSADTAEELLSLHHKTYPRYWEWSQFVNDIAQSERILQTVFGWNLYITTKTKPGTIKNYLMQANGAEMMRLACCFTIQKGIQLCTPVHDALLIEAPIGELDEAIQTTQEAMRKASESVLKGFPLESDVKKIIYPESYSDPRGENIWKTINRVLNNLKDIEDEFV